jgi:glycosyltransferase involved in cell wall biosynthesis
MKFSVLLSVYYKEKPEYLKEALKSIIGQTAVPDEIVLVKDGPLTSGLDAVINKYKNDYPLLFKIIALDKNMGLGNALNEGIKYCSYNIIARMDSDDICLPDRFEKQLRYLSENADTAIVGTYIDEFNMCPGDIKSTRKLPTTHSQLERISKMRNPFNHPTVMFKKDVVENVGSYQEIPLFEDYYLWLKIIKKGYTVANLSESLLYFRIGNDMIGRRAGWRYAKKEIHFYNTCIKNKLLTRKEGFFALSVRLPMRFVPKTLLLFMYRQCLRKSKKNCLK